MSKVKTFTPTYFQETVRQNNGLELKPKIKFDQIWSKEGKVFCVSTQLLSGPAHSMAII